MTVLIVDEEPSDRLLLRLTLEPLSTEIQDVASGQEALERARQQRPDLIVVDRSLPDLDGLALCRRLRADPATARSRIIALTVDPLAVSPEAARAAGIDAVLGKPFSPRHLVRVVRSLLPTRRRPTGSP